MKPYLKTLVPLVVLLMCWSISGVSQTRYQLSSSPLFKVEGGSSLHDWHMESHEAKGEGVFIVENGQLKGVQSLSLSLQAESLKSGTKGLDSNAYKALNTSKHKEIKFVLKQLTGSGTAFTAHGDLTIAGVSKAVSIPVRLSSSAGKFTFEGSLSTKLTTYSITPPTALMGTVKTHDDIKLSFQTTFYSNL